MRWDKLFDDLESQLEREITAEEVDLNAEEERLRLGRLGLRDRLMALHDAQSADADYSLALTLSNGARLTVHPASFGRDWFSADVVDESGRRSQCVVPIGAIGGIALDETRVACSLAPTGGLDGHPVLSARLGLAFVLRDLCRRRRPIDVELTGGGLHGTIDRVGRDHFDLAVHDRRVARHSAAVREYRVVPLAALLLVRLST